jgi:hypothetical protein
MTKLTKVQTEVLKLMRDGAHLLESRSSIPGKASKWSLVDPAILEGDKPMELRKVTKATFDRLYYQNPALIKQDQKWVGGLFRRHAYSLTELGHLALKEATGEVRYEIVSRRGEFMGTDKQAHRVMLHEPTPPWGHGNVRTACGHLIPLDQFNTWPDQDRHREIFRGLSHGHRSQLCPVCFCDEDSLAGVQDAEPMPPMPKEKPKAKPKARTLRAMVKPEGTKRVHLQQSIQEGLYPDPSRTVCGRDISTWRGTQIVAEDSKDARRFHAANLCPKCFHGQGRSKEAAHA